MGRINHVAWVPVGYMLAMTLPACSGPPNSGTSDWLSSRPSSTSSSASTPAESATAPAARAYVVGQTIPSGQFAGMLLEVMTGKSFRLVITKRDPVTCMVSEDPDVLGIVDAGQKVREVRFLREDAYVRDRPGQAKSWTRVDALPNENSTVPTQAIADAMNAAIDRRPGDLSGSYRPREPGRQELRLGA